MSDGATLTLSSPPFRLLDCMVASACSHVLALSTGSFAPPIAFGRNHPLATIAAVFGGSPVRLVLDSELGLPPLVAMAARLHAFMIAGWPVAALSAILAGSIVAAAESINWGAPMWG